MNKYWEEETPVRIGTDKNVFRYFPSAGKLQVSGLDWVDKDETTRQGKTVTIDLEAMRVNPKAVALFRSLFR